MKDEQDQELLEELSQLQEEVLPSEEIPIEELPIRQPLRRRDMGMMTGRKVVIDSVPFRVIKVTKKQMILGILPQND